jgi:hypothetical protein
LSNQVMNQLPWTPNACIRNDNAYIAPGGLPYTKLIATSASNPHWVGQPITFAAGEVVTMTFSLRAAEESLITLRGDTNATVWGVASPVFARFNAATGVATLGAKGASASMELVSADEWLCTVTTAATTAAGTSTTQLLLRDGTYAGDNTSGLFVSTFNITGTTYKVPLTVATTAPGIIGNHSMTATLSALGVTQGQAFGLGVEYVVAAGSPGSIRGILQVESAGGDNRCVVRTGSSAGTYQAIIRNAGSNAYIQQGSNTPDGQLNKIALRCNTTPSTGINGVLGAVGSGVTVPTDLDRIFIGYGTAAPRLSGRICNAYLIPATGSADASLSAMTA